MRTWPGSGRRGRGGRLQAPGDAQGRGEAGRGRWAVLPDPGRTLTSGEPGGEQGPLAEWTWASGAEQCWPTPSPAWGLADPSPRLGARLPGWESPHHTGRPWDLTQRDIRPTKPSEDSQAHPPPTREH